ncbi:unnamed protein product [Rhizoctonia solani]|uniref:Protein kinase domain-containing protein n=1 Tax=Rhizoctonia solani TaxID=456999 RepID=A0A8H3BDR9_9AGAM|nr:unnamed protein product [Rhizoctonia solani]
MAFASGFNQRSTAFHNEGGQFINNSTYSPALGSTTLAPWVPSIAEVSGSPPQYTPANGWSAPSDDKQSYAQTAPRMTSTPSNEPGEGSSQEHSRSTNVETSTQLPTVPNSQDDSAVSDRIVIGVTHDGANYNIDITNHVLDAQAIRQEISSKITNDPRSQFNISRIVSPDLETTLPLGDNELLITCLTSGDDRGTLKFLVDSVSSRLSPNPVAFHAQAPPLPPVLSTTASARFSMPEPFPWHEGGASTGGDNSSHHLDLAAGHVADLDRSGHHHPDPITNIDANRPMPEHTSPTARPSKLDASKFSVPYGDVHAAVGTSAASLPSPSTPPAGQSYIARHTLHSEPHEMFESEQSQRRPEHSASDAVRANSDPCPVPDGPRAGTISRRMTMDEVLNELYLHGCKNITPYLNRSMSGDVPMASGGFGDVYRGVLNNGRDVGLKCVRLEVDSDDGGRKKVKDAARELYIWSKCKHPNVLELIGVTQHRNQIAMVSPWMDNGDLTRFLHSHPEANRYDLCAQIADGVAYLHQENVVHGDLKGANILVSKEHTPKITDFGTASRTGYTLQFTETSRSHTMSLRWTAPEIVAEATDHNTFETDVFSLGMTILEVITGTPPFVGINDGAVVFRLVTGEHPTRPEAHLPTGDERADLLWSLLVECWALKPQDRPSTFEVRDRMRRIASM